MKSKQMMRMCCCRMMQAMFLGEYEQSGKRLKYLEHEKPKISSIIAFYRIAV